MLGQAPGSTLSSTGAGQNGLVAYGVWGDTAAAAGGNGAGVQGTADDNWGVLAANNSPGVPTIEAENLTATAGGEIFYGYVAYDNNIFGNYPAILGDPGCGEGYMALQLGQEGMSNCNNYTLLGDGANTYINGGAGTAGFGTISFRINNDSAPNAMTVNNNNSVTIDSLDVTTSLTKPSGSFKIDHPLDPANKYLYHSFVESPDMKNIYDGIAELDGNGEAVVSLPDWFQALNRNFRYQLTSIGSFAPVYIAEEMQNGQFKIAGGRSGIKVSWQVTGIRQDAFANAHRIQVEVEKAPSDRGHYLHPELFGAPETARIGYVASKMKSIPVEHQRRALPRRGNASPLPQRTPPSMPIPLRPAPPNPTPPLRSLAPAAQGNKLELNQK